jgi:hypothetical protein
MCEPEVPLGNSGQYPSNSIRLPHLGVLAVFHHSDEISVGTTGEMTQVFSRFNL